MSVHLLILALSKKGIKLWLEGDELRFSAPPGAFSAELKQQVKQQREQVIQFLKQSNQADNRISPRAQDAITYASIGQNSLYLAQQAIGDATSYNLVSTAILHEAFELELLRKTVTALVARYEILRTSFAKQSTDLLQVIKPQGPVEVAYHDFSDKQTAQAEHALQEVIAQEEQFAFNLDGGDLARFSLVKLDAEKFVLIVNIHHIVCDASSMSILIQELVSIYMQYQQGLPVDMAPVACQYADFALWQQQQLKSGQYDAQIEYWSKTLKDLPPLLDISTDLPRTSVNESGGQSLSFSLGRDNTHALQALARANGCTLFSLLLALYNLFLARYSGMKDIFVGSPFSGRTHPDLEAQIGYFVNAVVLRNTVDEALTFRGFLQQVQQGVVAAQKNQDVPFQSVQEALQRKAQAQKSTLGLYQVSFVFNNTDAELKAMANHEQQFTDNDGVISHAAKDDLSLQFTFVNEALTGKFTFKTALFFESTVRAYMTHFESFVEQILANPDTKLSALLSLLPAQQKAVLSLLVNQQALPPLPATSAQAKHTSPVAPALITQAIAQSCLAHADNIALEMAGESLTYAELNRRANIIANRLLAEGVELETPVAVSMQRSMDQAVAFYGILKAGAVFLPVDVALPADRRQYMLQTAKAKQVICDAESMSLYQGNDFIDCQLYDIASLSQGFYQGASPSLAITDAEPVFPKHHSAYQTGICPDNAAYIIFTSGTTGLPKGVHVTHKGIVNLALAQAAFFQIDKQSRVFQFASISFDAWVSEVVKTWVSGATLVVMKQEDILPGPALSEKLGAQNITHFTLSPSALAVLPKAPLTSLKTVVTAGEACAKDVAQSWSQQARFINAYGPSEATVCASMYVYDTQDAQYAALSIGGAMAGVSLYVLDNRMAPVPLGVPGMLYIGGQGLARGYIGRAGLTASRFVPNPFSRTGERLYLTGDLVKVRADGRLDYLGRDDTQVKLRGFRIELDEIAQALHGHPDIENAVAVLRNNPAGSPELVAYYCPRAALNADTGLTQASGSSSGLTPDLTQTLTAFLKTKLPGYMIPKVLVPLAQLPVSVNGKIDTKALPEPMWQGQTEKAQPATKTEKKLLSIFKSVLGVDLLGVNESFFDMGGNSLLVGQLGASIREQLLADISPRLIFEQQTVSAIAKLIDSGKFALQSADQKIEVVSKAQRRQLSFMQQRLWFLTRLEQGSSAYHIPTILQLTGHCNLEALKQALQDIQGRHEVLRTSFVDIDGVPAARVNRQLSLDMPVLDLCDKPDTLQQKLGECIDAPFDLSQGPLIRANVFRTDNEHHVLCVVMHHIISDGWSVGVLVNEITTLYSAYAEAMQKGLPKPSPLPELPIQYGDFAYWQRNVNTATQQESHLTFWLDALRGAPTLLNLPTDKVRKAQQSFKGATYVSRLPLSAKQAIIALGNRHGASVFMTLLSVFYLVLSRYASQSDILVGTPVANRHRPELEALIGFFVNTIVLRQDVAKSDSFDALLNATKKACLDAYSHQEYPFESLVEKINPERSQSHSPLFQVMFSQENTTAFDKQKDNLQVAALRDSSSTAKFDLSLSFMETDAGIDLYWEYSTDLFLANSIAALARHFNFACEQVIAKPEQDLRRLSIMPDDERALVLETWNDNALDLPQEANLADFVHAQVARTPEAVALVFEQNAHTYKALNHKANQLANHLMQQGVTPGSRVGVCLARSDELVLALLGVLKTGAAYVPIDPAYPRQRIHYMLEDAGAQWVLTQSDYAGLLGSQSSALILLDDSQTRAHIDAQATQLNPLPREIARQDLAYIIYTSGSTGQPKGVCVEQGSALAMLAWAHACFGQPALSAMLASTSVCFDLSIFELFAPLTCGGKVVMMRSILDLVDTQADELDVTFVNTVPSALNELVALQALPLSTQVVGVAGEALSRATADAFYQAYPTLQLFNLYGPSEDTTYSTIAQVPADPALEVSIGVPVSNTQAYILDDYLNPVPKGVRGELYLAGEGLTRGYWQRPGLTAERFLPNPFALIPGSRMYRTSDVVAYQDNAEMRFFGRDDRQVKIRGYRIEMGEIEQCLRQHTGVKHAIVVVKDDIAGPVLVAYFVPQAQAALSDTTTLVTEAELKAHLSQTLPEYFVPQYFVALPAVPLLPNGKTDFNALPNPLLTKASEAQHTQVAASGDTETRLLAIWCDILEKDTLSVTSNFFDLGGHSLLAIRLVSRIEKAFKRRVPLNVIFQKPTVQSLAAFIETLSEDNARETLPELIQDPAHAYAPFPLTPVQQAYWLGRQSNMTLGNIGTHTYQEMDFTQFDVAVFAQVVNQLIKRHDMMRMVINEKGEQQVLPDVPEYDLGYQDLSGLNESDKHHALMARRDALSHHVFDPSVWPLFNIKVTQIDAQQYRLYWSFDGLLMDGASHRILSRELLQLLHQPEEALPPIQVSFRDYVMTEERIKSLPAYEKARDYWLKRAGTLPLAAQLPLATDPSNVKQPVFSRRRFMLSKAEWDALKAKAAAHNITPTVMMLGVFSEVLALWSKTAHFSLNLTLFNRLPLHAQVNDIIGDFTSLTLLEVLREEGLSFKAFAQKIQNQLWLDLEHRLFGGIEVQRAMRQFHGSNTSVEIPIVFTSLLGFEADTASSGALSEQHTGEQDHKTAMSEGYGITQTSQVWLDHQVGEVNGALEVNWDAVEALFPEGVLDAMLATYQGALDTLANDDSAWQNTLLVHIPQAQQAQVLAINAYSLDSQQAHSQYAHFGNVLLHQGFEAHAQQRPDALAVIQGRTHLRYHQVNTAANVLANRIGDRASKPDSLIAVVMEKGWEQVVAVMATLKANAAYLPIDASAPAQRIVQLLESGNVEIVLTQPEFVQAEWTSHCCLFVVDETLLQADEALDIIPSRQPSDLAYVIFTSGSTGQPKGVVIPHHGAMTTIHAINALWSVGKDDKVLGLSALNFDLSVYDIFGVLGAGGCLVLPKKGLSRDTQHWCELMQTHQVSLWNTVPALMQLYVDALEVANQTCPASLRHVMMSGDWIPLTLPDRIKHLASDSIQVTSLGGATEASIWSVYYPIEGAIDPSWKSIPYGKPLPNQTLFILKDDHRISPTWAEGDIYIGGEGVAYGYWQDEARTNAAFMANKLTGERLYRTGDKGRYLPDGNIEFLGREDFQVKVQGYRIELGEIESHLIKHDFVNTAVVVANGASSDNKTLVAYVVPERFDDPSKDEAGVLQDANERQAFKLKRAGHLPFASDVPASYCIALPEADPLTQVSLSVLPTTLQLSQGPVALCAFARTLASVRPVSVPDMPLPKYFYASTGSLNAVQLYVDVAPNGVETLAAGTYYYDPVLHQLIAVSGATSEAGAGLAAASSAQLAQQQAQFALHYVVDYQAICPLYGKLGETLGEIEAGYVHQLLESVGATQGVQLSVNPTGLFHSQLAFGQLRDNQHLVFTAFGRTAVAIANTAAQTLLIQAGTSTASAKVEAKTQTHTSENNVALPKVSLPCRRTLTQFERQSYRQYQNSLVSQTQLASLLASASNLAMMSSSADELASQALAYTLYVYLKPNRIEGLSGGLYRYHNACFSLEKVADAQALRMDICHFGVNEPIYDNAAFGLYLVAKTHAPEAHTTNRNQDTLAHYQAGVIGQAMLAWAPEFNLGVCPIGFLNAEVLAPAMALETDASKAGLRVVHSFLGGPIAAQQKQIWDQQTPPAKTLAQRLIAQLETQLPTYMIPKTYVLLDALPLTANGKVDRKALPAPENADADSDARYVAPKNALQAKLVEIWEEVLLSSNVGIQDNFFTLGGDSLTAIQVTGRIQQATGVSVGLHQLFENPTIEGLSGIMDVATPSPASQTQQTASDWPALVHDEKNKGEPFPLTDVQHAYWLGRSGAFELGNVSCHSYLEIDISLYDHAVFEAGFNKLVKHHDMLRMVVNRDGLQRILDDDCYYTIDYLDLTQNSKSEKQQVLMARRERMSHQVHDPAVWPLFELSVIKHDESQYRLFWSIDLLLVDGSSQNMLTRDFQRIVDNPDIVFTKPAITFRDYVLGERQLRHTAVYQKARQYWENRVATLPAGPQLPLAIEPSQISVPRFKRHEFMLDKAKWDRIKTRAKRHGVTSSILLATAFSDVLARWSQQDSFCLNLTLFNRQPLHEDVFNIIGDFTSLTLLQIDKDRRLSFVERCRATQRQLWEDMEHKMFGGIEVLRLMRKQDPSVTMPVVFTSMLDTDGPQGKKDAAAQAKQAQEDERGYGISQTSQVWLDHQVNERAGRLVINWDVIEALFPEGMIEAMFAAYQTHVEALLDESAWLQSETQLMPAAQSALRQQINRVHYPCVSTYLHELFEQNAGLSPDSVALITGHRKIRYGELNNAANALAYQLIDLDAKPNELVAIVMRKGWEQIAAAIGILKSGAAYLPIDADLPNARILAILEQAKVKTLVTQAKDANKTWTAQRQVCVMQEGALNERLRENPKPKQSPHDLAYVIFTSGSTGTPKGVMIDHFGAVHTVEVMNYQYRVGPKDRVLGLSSMSFDLSVYDVFGLLSVGAAVVLPDADKAKDPAHWHELAHAHQLSLWNTVPALMQMWVDYLEETQQVLPASMRQVLLSGDYIPVTLPDRIKTLSGGAQQPVAVDSLGGATEASIWSIYYPIQKVLPHWKTIPYGKPLANQSYHVLKPDLSDCPDWVPGELYIGGSGVAKGYWQDQEKTASHFITHPLTGETLYRTGDMGRYFPDGNIEFLGRIDNQVKVQGHRIELGEIDSVMLKHPAVDKVTTLAMENDKGSKQLVSYVVPDLPEASFTGDKLIQDPVERSLFKMKRLGLRHFDQAETVVLTSNPRNLQDAKLGKAEPIRAFESQALSLSQTQITHIWQADLWQQNAVEEGQTLPLSALSDWLFALKAHILSDSAMPKYFYASTGSLNAIQCYLAIGDDAIQGVSGGVYYYAPDAHVLRRLPTNTLDMPSDTVLKNTHFAVHLVVHTNAIEPVYGDLALRLGVIEAGYMAELLLATGMALDIALWQDASAVSPLNLSQPNANSVGLKHALGLQENDLLALSFTAAYVPNAERAAKITRQSIDLVSRQSYRTFVQESLMSLSDLRGYLQHMQVCDGAEKLTPYLFIKPNRVQDLKGGYYRFDARTGEFGLVTAFDETEDHSFARYLGVNEAMQVQSAFALYWVAELTHDNLILSGALGQRLMSFSRDAAIGLCPVGDFMACDIRRDLALLPHQQILHSFVGGAITAQQSQVWAMAETSTEGQSGYSLEGSIMAFSAARLPAYMVPKIILFLEALPLTANGKIDRNALPKPQFAQSDRHESAPPSTQMQQQVAEIWREVLNLEHIGIDDNFTQIGGNSLSIVQVQTRFRHRFNVELDLRLFYEHQTIREQETVILAHQAQTQSQPASEAYSLSAIKSASAREQAKRTLANLTEAQKQALLKKAKAKHQTKASALSKTPAHDVNTAPSEKNPLPSKKETDHE